jgi:hypothetical protein
VIDFRYHLVSIVSIFLALAVGIVLGAGPLQAELGKTLTSQVATLRQEKADLRTQLDTSQRRSDAADQFASTLTPQLVGSRLGGRSVVLVALDGADSGTLRDLQSVLRTSGATISGTVKVQKSWVDPARASFRDQLAGSLGPLVGLTDTGGSSVDQRISAVLAKALVVASVAQAGSVDTGAAQALQGLKEAGLVTVDGDLTKLATMAVVVAGAPAVDATTDQTKAALAGYDALAAALDAASSGSAVVGPLTSTEPVGVLGAVRSDKTTAAVVSTVDDVDLPMGRVALVLALAEQLSGRSGQYGTGVGADAVLPAPTP